MNSVLYIAEGEIEEFFIDYLKEKSFILPGRFEKFNLMQNILKDTDRILTNKVDKIFCILDTDNTGTIFLERLHKNVKKLGEISKRKIYLLVQKEKFEDELKFILDTNDLAVFFKLKNHSLADIKRHLAGNVNYDKCISKENLKIYCSRYQAFQNLLATNKFPTSKIEFVSITACMRTNQKE